MAIVVILLLTTAMANNGETRKNSTRATRDPGEPLANIFNSNDTIEPRQFGYGLVKFEGQQNSYNENDQKQYGFITFEQSDRPFKFKDQTDDIINAYHENSGTEPNYQSGITDINDDTQSGQGIVFQDDNRIEGQNPQKKKRRRRRRKQRFQQLPQGYPGFQYPRPGLGFPQGRPNPYLNPGFHSGLYRPSRHPRPSVASDALSAVTGALSSIALYDDYQCVPRLLCEAAGGGALGTAGSSGLLQSIAGLQPLLTLLSAYNGVSTSPLFVFGRAVFLGMTSKGNPGTCRYAYSLCPTDPEQLVHYLNNHNGGFFRFFSAPQLSNPQYGLQNLEQFYNQLSAPGQYDTNQPNDYLNYGLYRPNPALYNTIQQPYPGQLTVQQPDFATLNQNYGLYSNNFNHQQFTNYGFHKPSLYSGQGYQQSYGSGYPYTQNQFVANKIGLKENKNELELIKSNTIQKRIQNNKPDTFVEDKLNTNYQNSKWLFPEDVDFDNNFRINYLRDEKYFKFPEIDMHMMADGDLEVGLNKRARGFQFPETQSIRQYSKNYNNLKSVISNIDFRFENEGYPNVEIHNGQSNNHNEDEIETIYVVRGNGDPNYPEIIKLRPGEKLQ